MDTSLSLLGSATHKLGARISRLLVGRFLHMRAQHIFFKLGGKKKKTWICKTWLIWSFQLRLWHDDDDDGREANNRPVGMPQPKRQILVRSARLLILAQQASSTTVYWLNTEMPKKWYMGLPSKARVNRVVFLSEAIRPLPQLNMKTSHILVLLDLHMLHFWHSACHAGMHLSPGFRPITFAPKLSTILFSHMNQSIPSWFSLCKPDNKRWHYFARLSFIIDFTLFWHPSYEFFFFGFLSSIIKSILGPN